VFLQPCAKSPTRTGLEVDAEAPGIPSHHAEFHTASKLTPNPKVSLGVCCPEPDVNQTPGILYQRRDVESFRAVLAQKGAQDQRCNIYRHFDNVSASKRRFEPEDRSSAEISDLGATARLNDSEVRLLA